MPCFARSWAARKANVIALPSVPVIKPRERAADATAVRRHEPSTERKYKTMTYVLIRHKVADFAKWKTGYDAHLGARQQAGLKEKHLLRNIQNPNEVVILFEADDLKKAQKFASSSDLRETMEKVGVLDKPDIYFLS